MKAFRLALLLCLAPAVASAQTKISQFPAATAITGTELVPVIQGSLDKVTTPSALLTYIQGAIAIPATAITSGNLAVALFNSGTSASNTTFWRGDGTWATPAGAGTMTSSGPPTVGSLASFSTTTNLVTGNLSGDCTTSGALVITCTKTSGSPFATSATTDTTNATNITTGTIGAALLPGPTATTLGGIKSQAAVTHKFFNSLSTAGVIGTATPACADLSDATFCNVSLTNGVTLANIAQIQADRLLGNLTGSTANMAAWALPSCSTATSALIYNTTTHSLACHTIASGSGVPGGALTQVQYDAAGAFGGITGATSDGTTLTLVAPILGTPASATLTNATGLPLTTGVTGVLPVANGGTGVTATRASSASHPLVANTPISTNNTTLSMGGLAGAITPATSGNVLITVSGDLSTSVGLANVAYEMHYGTGTAPTANQNPAIGTTLGAAMRAKPNAAGIRLPFSMTYLATGLSVGTAYWIDLAFDTDNASNAANFENVNIVAVEIP